MGEERRKIHVLAVDDDRVIRELLVEFLAHAGCQVFTASNGVEALAILEGQSIDLLITDYDMPRMDGFELIRRTKARFPRLTAVMITGESTQVLAADRRDCEGLRILRKPFSGQHLLSLLEEIRGATPAA